MPPRRQSSAAASRFIAEESQGPRDPRRQEAEDKEDDEDDDFRASDGETSHSEENAEDENPAETVDALDQLREIGDDLRAASTARLREYLRSEGQSGEIDRGGEGEEAEEVNVPEEEDKSAAEAAPAAPRKSQEQIREENRREFRRKYGVTVRGPVEDHLWRIRPSLIRTCRKRKRQDVQTDQVRDRILSHIRPEIDVVENNLQSFQINENSSSSSSNDMPDEQHVRRQRRLEIRDGDVRLLEARESRDGIAEIDPQSEEDEANVDSADHVRNGQVEGHLVGEDEVDEFQVAPRMNSEAMRNDSDDDDEEEKESQRMVIQSATKAFCYLCRYKANPLSKYDSMLRSIWKSMRDTNPQIVCLMMSLFYKAHMKKDKPDWPPYMVWEHYTQHVKALLPMLHQQLDRIEARLVPFDMVAVSRNSKTGKLRIPPVSETVAFIRLMQLQQKTAEMFHRKLGEIQYES